MALLLGIWERKKGSNVSKCVLTLSSNYTEIRNLSGKQVPHLTKVWGRNFKFNCETCQKNTCIASLVLMVGEGWDNALTKLFSTRGGVFWEFCRDKSDEPELFAEPPIWKEKYVLFNKLINWIWGGKQEERNESHMIFLMWRAWQ